MCIGVQSVRRFYRVWDSIRVWNSIGCGTESSIYTLRLTLSSVVVLVWVFGVCGTAAAKDAAYSVYSV